MSFDSLVNIRMPEEEIFDRVAEILQRNFSVYQDIHICLPLSPMDGSLCSITEVRLYDSRNEKDIAAKREFIFSGEFFQAYASARFRNSFYDTSIGGHFLLKIGCVYPNSIKILRRRFGSCDLAKEKAPPKELIIGAFAEITEELWKKKVG